MRVVLTGLRALLFFTMIAGVLYTGVVTGVAQIACRHQANGSLVTRGRVVVGSELIAQKSGARYFLSRPSASDYGAVPSGASHFGPTSLALKEVVEKRKAEMGQMAPPDLLFASGSGLDPHISPEAAQFQFTRVVEERRLTPAQSQSLRADISKLVEGPTFGVLGQTRINTLRLNLLLDEKY